MAQKKYIAPKQSRIGQLIDSLFLLVLVYVTLFAPLVLGPIERFPDAKHVTSYVGLIPREDSSAGRQHFGHLTKQGNSLLRFLLVEAAQVASRYDAALGRVYRRLAFRKGAASAKVAVARKLAIRLYIMLRDGINYQEFCRRGSHAGMLVNKPMVCE